ncbi:MAG: O-antigen ligase family protein [Candidatus Thiothrix putei]|uniref:O-antigen ligase family protein n=1 Tax=Candidatus Thiothrix putei TaxID=3080811 RepID=A0AA95KNX5_9GAMM|nr:MAG: O-antigen ligase family protein [Candidatus Thiothrix putei]
MLKNNNLNGFKNWKSTIGLINSWLLILLAFSFIMSIAIGSAIMTLILLLWLIEGNFSAKFQRIKHHPITWAILAFILLHFIGLLWTSDWDGARFVLKKEIKYLLLPVLMTVVRPEHIRHYLVAFILSMVVMVGLSYGLYVDMIPSYEWLRLEQLPDSKDTTPFVSHIVYSPVLALTLYLLLYAIFLRRDALSTTQRIAGIILFILMGINLFITEGRMGQLVFLVLLSLFVFQYYQGKYFKPALFNLALLITIVPTAYLLSPVMQERVDQAFYEAQHYEEVPNSSVGLRVIMLLNSFEIIQENPVFGVGTGDYQQEYYRVNQQKFPEATRGEILAHSHNVYVQQMVLFGIFGLAVLLYLFYTMFNHYQHSTNPLRPFMLAFTVFYAVIFLTDGYLMDHYLTFLFLWLGALLFADYEHQYG